MRYQIRKGIISRDICGECLLVATGEAAALCPEMKQLNSTGAFFWHLIEEGCTEEELISRAIDHFDIDEARIRTAVPAFLNELVKHHYILPLE